MTYAVLHNRRVVSMTSYTELSSPRLPILPTLRPHLFACLTFGPLDPPLRHRISESKPDDVAATSERSQRITAV
jgi:hypothetical protein